MQVDESCNVELQDDFFVNSIAGKSKRFDALDGHGRVSSMGMGQREYGSCSA